MNEDLRRQTLLIRLLLLLQGDVVVLSNHININIRIWIIVIGSIILPTVVLSRSNITALLVVVIVGFTVRIIIICVVTVGVVPEIGPADSTIQARLLLFLNCTSSTR